MDTERRRSPHHLVDALLMVVVFGIVAGVFTAERPGTARVVALVGAGRLLVGLGFWKLPQRPAEGDAQDQRQQGALRRA